MVVVGGGSSTRFGSDKLLAEIGGRPLITHTLGAIAGHVDVCVVVCGAATAAVIRDSHPDVKVVSGGPTRTASEMAGLAGLDGEPGLIGIHDAARPAVEGRLIEQLFDGASAYGGAVPLLEPERVIIERRSLSPVSDLRLAQTPQVFDGPALLDAYARAEREGFVGFDTVEVMQRYSDVRIIGVPGDRSNIKVTHPWDLGMIAAALSGLSHT
jgi:2-C-methyl-D-erythritol 4-phosphate cytidylyltransferase